MAVSIGPFRIPWPSSKREDDPYWDFFINGAPQDPDNVLARAVAAAAEGNVNPVKSEIHSPDVMSGHLKELGRFFGSDLVGIVRLGSDAPDGYPLAIVHGVSSEHDTRVARGIGGQKAALEAACVGFNLSAYIRELGYGATSHSGRDPYPLAAAAGLCTLDADGRPVSTRNRAFVHLGDPILTNLPLAEDGICPTS